MPKGRSPQDILDELSWVNNLTETSWSQGILDTATDLKLEIEKLGEEKKRLNEEIDQKMRKRLKVLRALPGRANREADLLYTEEQVVAAKQGKVPAEE